MEKIKRCLNEWNVTTEALGKGIQSILLRKYNTRVKEFLLYPTVSYALKNDYLESFKDKYKPFVVENSLPTSDGRKMEVKYFAKVESIIEKPTNGILKLSNYHIWTNSHVKSYLGGRKAYVWVLRVYKLEIPMLAERTKGFRYANLLEPVSLKGIEPVLSDSEFDEVLNNLR